MRYRFPDGSEARYWISTELALRHPKQTFTTLSTVALSVATVAGPGVQATTLQIGLGPGEVHKWSTEAPVVVERDPSTLRAEVDIDSRGTILARRRLEGEGSETLLSLWETLLGRDALPEAPVGAGARWKQVRKFEEAYSVRSDFELIRVEAESFTVRVQREQRQAEADVSLETIGEWTVSSGAWPPLGIERVHAVSIGPSGEEMTSSFALKPREKEE